MVRASALIALFCVAACGSSDMPDPCIDSPTYTNDVLPIAQAKCVGCHSTSKQGPQRNGAPEGYDFDNFDTTMPKIHEFADAITSGREPPMDANLPTTAAERETVRAWRMCAFKR